MIFYIRETASEKSAVKVLNKIEKSIHDLGDFPYMGTIPRHSVIRKLGYRIMIVDKSILFYKVFEDKKKILVYGICDYRQDYINLL